MLLKFTTTHLLTSRPTLRSRSPCASWAPPLTGGLCGDLSPHRTTMTQTKCCPIFAFWVVVVCLSNGSSRSHRACDSAGCSLMLVVLQRVPPLYGRRPGQPSSSSLARRACVHYSGCSPFYCMASLVFVPFKFVYWLFLKFASAPGLSGGRGEMAMAVASSARLAFLRGAVCACCTPYTRCCPFLVPVQRWSIELPATTVGERRRRRSLRRHKGGLWTVFLTSCHKCCCSVAFKCRAYEGQTVSGQSHIWRSRCGKSAIWRFQAACHVLTRPCQ